MKFMCCEEMKRLEDEDVDVYDHDGYDKTEHAIVSKEGVYYYLPAFA